jgi:hypothetical protein
MTISENVGQIRDIMVQEPRRKKARTDHEEEDEEDGEIVGNH